MAFITGPAANRMIVGLLIPVCLMLLSLVEGNRYSAYGSTIQLQLFDNIAQPPGSGIPSDTFTVTHTDVPSVTFIGEHHLAVDPAGSAFATASANLTTGELKTFATTTGPYSAAAFALMSDTLSVAWADPSITDPISFTATFTLHSSFFGSSSLTYPGGFWGYSLGSVSGFYPFGCGTCPFTMIETKTIVATPFVPLPFSMNIRVEANSLDMLGSTTFDAGHTAGFSLVLPEGAFFTSGSGFLLNPLAAVPEPSTSVLLGLGLAVLVFCEYRQRQGCRTGTSFK